MIRDNSDVIAERFPELTALQTLPSEVVAAPQPPAPAIDLDAAFDEMFDD
jgi:hypothetical protein